jgi:hypothetical protein
MERKSTGDKSKEFRNFEELARKIVNVSKKDVQELEKAEKKKKEAKKP